MPRWGAATSRAGAVLGAVVLLGALPLRADPARLAGGTASAVDPLGYLDRGDATARVMLRLAASTCGVERWPVKTGTDHDRSQVRRAAADATIRALRAKPVPASRPQADRAGQVERTTYRIHGRLTAFKREDDGDYHLVVADSRHRTVIVEIPQPSCVGGVSPFKPAIRTARHRMDRRYGVTSSYQTANRRVVVRGVGFFDTIHGQTGVAPNGLELHPVTGLSFP